MIELVFEPFTEGGQRSLIIPSELLKFVLRLGPHILDRATNGFTDVLNSYSNPTHAGILRRLLAPICVLVPFQSHANRGVQKVVRSAIQIDSVFSRVNSDIINEVGNTVQQVAVIAAMLWRSVQLVERLKIRGSRLGELQRRELEEPIHLGHPPLIAHQVYGGGTPMFLDLSISGVVPHSNIRRGELRKALDLKAILKADVVCS